MAFDASAEASYDAVTGLQGVIEHLKANPDNDLKYPLLRDLCTEFLNLTAQDADAIGEALYNYEDPLGLDLATTLKPACRPIPTLQDDSYFPREHASILVTPTPGEPIILLAKMPHRAKRVFALELKTAAHYAGLLEGE